ncbi:MAG: hypothetical protein ACT4OE_10480 [Sphingosinicella sp.]
MLEIARAIHRLIETGRLARPERTIRFIWPAEIEATIALLNARPEFARRTLATVHLDMIGGNTEVTGSILRVRGSPPSLPSFVSDVGFAFGDYVNRQSLEYADSGEAALPLLDPQGSRHALRAIVGGFDEGSDHQVWSEGSWRIPVIYLADWPDRYIHTQRDLPANLDPTKLRRAIFIAAASGYFLARLSEIDTGNLTDVILQQQARRGVETWGRSIGLQRSAAEEADSNIIPEHSGAYEIDVHNSRERFGLELIQDPSPPRGWEGGPVYRRLLHQGPMNGFGYSWFDDRLARAGLARPRLLAREPEWDGPSFGYEALNLVDGRRSVGEIRNALAATVGRAPVEEVAEYLDVLVRLGVIAPVEP